MPSSSPHSGIEVKIASDASQATLVLWPDASHAALNVEALTKLIQDKGVIVTDELPALLNTIIAAFNAKPGEHQFIVARGIAPIHGQNAVIEWQPECNPNPSPAAASSTTDGAKPAKVDYYNQTHYIAVTAGMHMATLRAATAGENGCDVTGKILKAKAGAALPLKTDNSVKIESDGRIIAQIDGVINFRDGFIKVLPLFEIPGAVNFATGNVIFKGCIVVRGDVCDRFIVKSSEDVTVYGLIGAATIICGRNFIAHCGMAAHEHGCLFVGNDAQVGYIKNGHGLIHGSLMARRELINCELAIGGNLSCDAGAVVGGTLTIAGTGIIGTLGAATGTPTTLIFGTHPCQDQACDALHLQAAPAKPDATKPAPPATSTPPAAPPASATPSKTPLTTKTDAKPADNINQQVNKFIEQVRNCVDQSGQVVTGNARNVDLTIAKTLHPGVSIRSGRTRVTIDKTLRGPIRIRGNQTEGLTYQIGAEGVWHPLTDLAKPLKRAG